MTDQNTFDPFTSITGNDYDFEGAGEAIPSTMPTEVSNEAFGGRTRQNNSYETITNMQLTWKSNEKAFQAYDFESKQSKIVPNTTEYIALTTTYQITGSRPAGKPGTPSAHWVKVVSNEFMDTNVDLVRVREFDSYEDSRTVVCKGLYSEVKEIIKGIQNASFTVNIYALIRGTDKVVKFQFKGASRQAGFDISDSKNMVGKGFKIPSSKEEGTSIKYNVPIVEFFDITPEEDKKATDLAVEIETRLNKNRAKDQNDIRNEIQAESK